jgi:hypothetical protein
MAVNIGDDRNAQPLTTQQILAGLATVAPNSPIRARWTFAGKAAVHDWHGVVERVMRDDQNRITHAVVFYSVANRGVVQFLANKRASGLEVIMPADGVSYLQIDIEAPAEQQLPNQFVERAEQGNRASQEDAQNFQFEWTDVASWNILDRHPQIGPEVVKNCIAQKCEVKETSSPHRKLAFQCIEAFISAACSLEDFTANPEFVSLGNLLVRSLRTFHAEEASKVTQYDIARHMKEEDYVNDPLGKALQAARDAAFKPKTKFRNKRFCDFCKKSGHTEAYCWAKEGKDPKTDPKPGNGVGVARRH